ncbi:uncharacterized protein BO95DRAFT_440214 [Aspergillus brunneoviolaceus CBS 621.78]|uniref:Uncharacterized protein n=1 Tax=Aspergillus brunneoviolaceus CBS 621.78 TaxID=1450534 RepID=A0ACD1GGY9_9EURO|nr:hypothetical protein BO95DRAFT_440214 [Aspergillus brunneoviolaceus CBS 621.78]RAH48423.1 hypothetical protein BO95DRAFT_440214 [Aspergillus brunneoviolaceus CBS 621.78]
MSGQAKLPIKLLSGFISNWLAYIAHCSAPAVDVKSPNSTEVPGQRLLHNPLNSPDTNCPLGSSFLETNTPACATIPSICYTVRSVECHPLTSSCKPKADKLPET